MNTWNNRPFDVANLYNPAYLGRIMTAYVESYSKTTGRGLPLEILYVTLPLIFVKSYRDRLPLRSNALFHKWLMENNDIKFNYFSSVKQLLPYIKEALIFLVQRKIILLEGNELCLINSIKQKLKTDTLEVQSTLKKAVFMGKWISKIEEPEMIYSFMEVQV